VNFRAGNPELVFNGVWIDVDTTFGRHVMVGQIKAQCDWQPIGVDAGVEFGTLCDEAGAVDQEAEQ
jgi:hypothetical protein